MADQTNEHARNGEVDGSGDAEGIQPVPSQASTDQDLEPTAPAVHARAPSGLGLPPGLQRSGTLPTQNAQHDPNANRPRGCTISARPQNLTARELSPRSQLLGRSPAPAGRGTEGSPLGAIQEGVQARSREDRPRGSTTTERDGRGSFNSPGMRPRMSTFSIGPSPTRGPSRRVVRRGTVKMAPANQDQGISTGRDMDAQSANFTLAGPGPMESQAANTPYVDPGYSDLNPAYDQPINTRPVWGLAKPLPRVVRPGMVPTRSELNLQIPNAEQRRQDPANVDLEQGRLDPTLKLGKVTSQLQNAREDRENRFLAGNLQRTGTGLSPMSPSSARRQTSNLPEPFNPSSHAIEEEDEEDLGLAKLQPSEAGPLPGQEHLPPVPEQTAAENQGWYPDDAASVVTEKAGDDDLDGDYLHSEDVPFAGGAYDAETEEIHNLHTHWSVIRLRFREPLAELLAVTVQLTLGFCADLVVTVSSGKAGNEETTDWAWGLATMIGIYIAGGISGAHLNPAISIMLWIYRGFPLRKIPMYMFAQILGAFIAAMIAFGLYQEGIYAYAPGVSLGNTATQAAFICYPRYSYIGGATAFFTEFTGTAVLSVAVLALGDDTNAPPGAGMNAFILGLVITALSMAFGYNTGAAMNPARDLGPRLALLALGYGKGIFTNVYWIYGNWVGPISGAIFGAFLYDAAIFVGGESPVNYPRKRIARAGKKWKRRWAQKIRNARGRVVRQRGNSEGFEGVRAQKVV